MIKIVDPDGGELGSTNEITNAEDIQLTLHIVSNIFKFIRAEIPSHKIASYCVSIKPEDEQVVRSIITAYQYTHPSNEVSLYTCDGKNIFDVRGEAGGIVSRKVFYIITTPKMLEIR